MKYIESLNLKTEEKDKATNELVATQAKHEVEKKIADLKSKQATLAAAAKAALARKPLIVDSYVDTIEEGEAVAKRLAAIEKVYTELF